MPKFIIQGQEFHINVKELEEKMMNVKPKEHFENMHSVEIKGKLFPLKQPILVTTGLSTTEITMLEAYMILEKLGYSIDFHR